MLSNQTTQCLHSTLRFTKLFSEITLSSLPHFHYESKIFILNRLNSRATNCNKNLFCFQPGILDLNLFSSSWSSGIKYMHLCTLPGQFIISQWARRICCIKHKSSRKFPRALLFQLSAQHGCAPSSDYNLDMWGKEWWIESFPYHQLSKMITITASLIVWIL